MSKIVYTEIDASTATSQNVTTEPANLHAVWVSTVLSAHTVTINDGAGGTNINTLAASAAVGDKVEGYGITMESGINLGCNALGTGKVIVAWSTAV